jgi:glutamate/tyrosine decarboxylase-like PLP-dependent enzyme
MKELTLDPENWDEFRELSHQSLDLMIDYLKGISKEKPWQPIPDEIKKEFEKALPQEPENKLEIIEDFKRIVMPYALKNVHPRFWGWVIGNGSPFQIIASILTSGLNSPGGSFEQSSTYMEIQVVEWMKEVFDFPENSSGILVNGGSMANYIGLAVARQTKLNFDIREEGFQRSKNYFTLYCSSEAHFSVQKAVEALGFGKKALRKIPVNAKFEINIPILVEKITSDKEKGFIPICIIGNAGTVNTGAIDDLETLAEISETENMWFHVDGAFGALLALSPNLKTEIKGYSKADSLAFDFHKWLHIQYDAACVLIKSEDLHLSTFALSAHYTAPIERGVASGIKMFSDYGLELSREFKSLKVWMSIKEQGIKKFGSLIEQNINQAKYLGSLVESHKDLELIAPVSMQIVCLRYFNSELNELELNNLNQEILLQLQERGLAVPSSTELNNKYVIRVNITNHRSKKEDFDFLVENIVEIGNEFKESFNSKN